MKTLIQILFLLSALTGLGATFPNKFVTNANPELVQWTNRVGIHGQGAGITNIPWAMESPSRPTYKWSWEYDTNEVAGINSIARKGFTLLGSSAANYASFTNDIVITNFGYGGCIYLRRSDTNAAFYIARDMTPLGAFALLRGIEVVAVANTNDMTDPNSQYARSLNITASQSNLINGVSYIFTSGTNFHHILQPGVVQLDQNTNGASSIFVDTNGEQVQWFTGSGSTSLQNDSADIRHGTKITFGWRMKNYNTVEVYASGQPSHFLTLNNMADWSKFQNFWVESWPNNPTLQYSQWCIQSIAVWTYDDANWPQYQQYVILREVQAQGTQSQHALLPVSGQWTNRWFNTFLNYGTFCTTNAGAGKSGSNSFTLTPGKYFIEAWAPHYASDRVTLRLTNVTAGTLPLYGRNSYLGIAVDAQQWAGLQGRIFITANSTFMLEQYFTAGNSLGYGIANNISGTVETYTEIKITKE